MKKALILSFLLIFSLGLIVGYIPSLASPGPGAPSPGHTASQIGGDSDAERTFASSGKYTFLGALDVRSTLTVNGIVSASAFKTRNQACPSGWTCEVNTWDIAAQSIRAYGNILLSSNKYIGSETGDLTIDAHITGRGTIHMYDDVNIAGNLDVRGFTLHHHGGDLKITCDGCGRGDGGRALVHDTGDTLVINYAGDFSGGARVDSSLKVGGTLITQNFIGPRVQIVRGPDEYHDNQWHIAECPNGYGMIGITVKVSTAPNGVTYWDGWLSAICVDMSGILDTSNSVWVSWYSTTNHEINCDTWLGSGYVVTGIKSYATTYLTQWRGGGDKPYYSDGLQIKCTKVKMNYQVVQGVGYRAEAERYGDNKRQVGYYCLPGTYMRGLSVVTYNTGELYENDNNHIECASIYS